MRVANLGGLTVRLTGGSDGSGGGDGPVVVLLHGFGAPGDDLVPLGQALGLGAAVRFAFPEAPLALPGMFMGGRAWWMIDVGRFERAAMTGTLDQLADEVPDGMAEARERVVAMLDALQGELTVAGQNLVLGGFSQGAMLACDVALRDGRPLAGLALMSTTLLAQAEWLPLMAARAGLPVFQSHGRGDPLLPFSLAEKLRDELTCAGALVDWVPFDGGHEIPPPAFVGLREFVQRILSA